MYQGIRMNLGIEARQLFLVSSKVSCIFFSYLGQLQELEPEIKPPNQVKLVKTPDTHGMQNF